MDRVFWLPASAGMTQCFMLSKHDRIILSVGTKMTRNSDKAVRRFTRLAVSLLILVASFGGLTHAADDANPIKHQRRFCGFKNPEAVSILGYDGDAMEPFITRDGKYLFFNNLNDPSVDTNLHYAKKIDDVTFEYMGEIMGVNSLKIEGVPTMDLNNNLYFVSTRSYKDTLSTIYRGRFSDGSVSEVEIVRTIPPKKPLFVNFDVEVSPDGETLYFVIGKFGLLGRGPKSSDIHVAVKSDGGFKLHERDEKIMRNVNTDALEYAAAVSADGLEIFFTRLNLNSNRGGVFSPPNIGIYAAKRSNKSEAFGPPKKIEAIKSFAEAPSPSPNGRSLYYHKKVGDRFVIYRVSR